MEKLYFISGRPEEPVEIDQTIIGTIVIPSDTG